MKRLAASLLVLCVLGARALADEPPHVAIVKSQELAPYAEAVTAFGLEAKLPMVEYDLRGDEERAKKAFAAMKQRRPALVWALGPLAATMARRELPDVPLVFALVPTHEKYDLAGPLVTGISLSPGPRGQLEVLKALAPKAVNVGVIYDPRASGVVVEQAGRAAQELGLKLVPALASDAADVGAKVKELAGRVDALWMVADRTVSTVSAFEKILQFSQEKRVPLFALSEEQVRSGALVSLSPDVAAIGRQAAKLVNRIVLEGTSVRALPVVEPEALDLTLNLTAARRLATGSDLAMDALTFAARRRYPVRVFE